MVGNLVIRSVTIIVLMSSVIISLNGCGSEKKRDIALERYDELEAQQIAELEREQKERIAELQKQNQPTATTRKPNGSQATDTQAAATTGSSDTPLIGSEFKTDGVWRIVNDATHPVTGEAVCAVQSRSEKVMNGEIETSVSLAINSTGLYLRTDAVLDQTNTEFGLSVDSNIPHRFDRPVNQVTAGIENNLKPLFEQMSNGGTAIVHFSYIPQLSADATHFVAYELSEFSNLFDQLAECAASSN